MTNDEAIAKWKSVVHDNGETVDPHNEMDWQDLAVGFFMGLGFTVNEAKALYELCIERGCF